MEYIQQLINGLMQGSLYALISIGFTLIYGVIGKLNLAHGEVFMISGFLSYGLLVLWHVPLYLLFPLTIIVAAVMGLAIEMICFRPIKSKFHYAPLVATISFSIVISETITNLIGSETKAIPKALAMPTYSIGNLIISSSQVLLLSVSLVVLALLSLFLKKTKIGKAMRAISESEETAKLLGIPIHRIVLSTFMIASSLAGIAGVLFVLRFETVNPFIGAMIGLKGMAVMMVGGLGNLYGAMLAGLLLGILETLAISLPYGTAPYVDGIVWGVMIIILIFRPAGLMGRPIGLERV